MTAIPAVTLTSVVIRGFAVCFASTFLFCSCGAGPAVSSKSFFGGEAVAGAQPGNPETNASGNRGRRRHRNRGPRGGNASGSPGGAEPGKFDFYVLSLSWSPGFCATAAGRADELQCGPERRFAFVLHGLWPQYERGGWPENCSTEAVDESMVRSMLAIMPSPKLVAHEWEKHGTCSGLSPKDYFEEATEAFQSIQIPPRYRAPSQTLALNPDQLQQDFARANPGLPDDSLVVLCSGNGRYLQEVGACLTDDLEGRRCNREVLRDACKSDRIVMRPVR